MSSERTDKPTDVIWDEFPSGSYWDSREVESVGFEAMPRTEDFEIFNREIDKLARNYCASCSEIGSDILTSIKHNFGVSASSKNSDIDPSLYPLYRELEEFNQPPSPSRPYRAPDTRSKSNIGQGASSPFITFSSEALSFEKSAQNDLVASDKRNIKTTQTPESTKTLKKLENLNSTLTLGFSETPRSRKRRRLDNILYSSPLARLKRPRSGQTTRVLPIASSPPSPNLLATNLETPLSQRHQISEARCSQEFDTSNGHDGDDYGSSDEVAERHIGIFTRADSQSLPSPLRHSPTDSDYLPSSTVKLSSSPTPATRGRAEGNTNHLMNMLFDHVRAIINDQISPLRLIVEEPSDPLILSINGQKVTTYPDLVVSLKVKARTIALLDYEGKRKYHGKGKDQLFGQELSHLIGRATFNRAEDLSGGTKYRSVFLVTAHHTSVSIMASRIKEAYLKTLNENPEKLKRCPRQMVYQYGPVDLSDPDSRVRFVTSVYRLLSFLVKRLMSAID